jgi:hypothetical protein
MLKFSCMDCKVLLFYFSYFLDGIKHICLMLSQYLSCYKYLCHFDDLKYNLIQDKSEILSHLYNVSVFVTFCVCILEEF